MTPETFIEQFETLAEAPNGIAKLRELILQLAVQGKLVPQDANDEPAVTMFDVEDSRIDPRSRVRRQSPRMTFPEKDIPFRLPQSWTWTTLSAVATLENGDRSKNYPNKTALVDDGIPFINAGHLKDGRLDMTEMNYITKERFEILHSGKIRPNDILLCLRGSLGKCGTVETLAKGAIASSLVIVRPSPNIDPGFMLKYLASPLSTAMIRRFDNGTAQPNLSAADLRKFLVPLPPLAEQRRIVLKVDQLLVLCDELAARQAARREARLALVGATLDRLVSRARNLNTSSPSPRFGERGSGGEGQHRSQRRPPHPQPFSPVPGGEGSKDMDANRLRDHFDRLFDTPTTIPQLRQAILQLAVQGQLVPQDPNDEPAIVLLARLNEANLANNGRAKRTRNAIEPDTDEFPLPHGWSWCQLAEVSQLLGGFAFQSSTYVPKSNNQIIRLGNVKNDELLLQQNPAFVSDEIAEQSSDFLLRPNDVLVTMTGTKKKRDYLFTTLVREEDLAERRLYLNQRVGLLRFGDPIVARTANVFLKADSILDRMFAQATGTANQGNIGAGTIRESQFPIPPLSEQKRIVSKVTALLSLCDALEAKLTQAEYASTQLLSAAIHHLITGANPNA